MAHATPLWPVWQSPLSSFAWAFTRPGFRRCAEWITALAINLEEHTITQSVTALERAADWKALETFAEYGSWRAGYVTDALTGLVEKAPGRLWHGYHVSAVDDTTVHHSGAHVWGTRTFHEDTARCPNRATTVRTHNGVVLGALLHNADQPAWFLPVSGRLSFRKSQLPAQSGAAGPKEEFRTKGALAVELIREQARAVAERHLAVFDGGSTPCGAWSGRGLSPRTASPGSSSSPGCGTTPGGTTSRPRTVPRESGGPKPKWGKKLPPPRQGGRWTRWWQEGHAYIFGRRRKVLGKEVVCLWRVSGHEVPVKAVAAEVEGNKTRFTLVTSATG
jgi:DDE superfamily endonuclease